MASSITSVRGGTQLQRVLASKAALRSFSRTWLNELIDRKMRATMLSPGQVWTPIQERMFAPFEPDTKLQFDALIPRGAMACP
ncbi:hypothetical protein AWC13_21835 [Mycobacterium kubicae]|nr:hypothetical protein AWC13_21835 [Mycobacterium kubicae]